MVISKFREINWSGFPSWIVALSALLLTIYEGRQSRIHDRLSVKPIVNISFHYTTEGNGYIMSTPGLGPAVVKSFVIKVDGQPVNSWEGMVSALQIPSSFIDGPNTKFVNPISSYPANQEFKLFWFPSGQAADLLKQYSKRVEIIISYCSIYETNCWSKSTKSKTVSEVDPYLLKVP